MIDYAMVTKCGAFAVHRPARTLWEVLIRRAGKKSDHPPTIWGIRRTILLPTKRLEAEKSAYAPVKWNAGKLNNALRGVEKARYEEGTYVPEPPEVGQLIKAADARFEALAPWPRQDVQPTNTVLNQASYDGAREVLGEKGAPPQREFLYEGTRRVVVDKQNAALATDELRSTYYAPLWISY